MLLQAMSESRSLLGLENNLITPRNGELIIGATQDFITGSFLMTRNDTFFDFDSFMQTVLSATDCKQGIDIPIPAILKPARLWTGKQAYSTMFQRFNSHPEIKVNMNLIIKDNKRYSNNKKEDNPDKGNPFCKNEGLIEFYQNELVSGALGKSSLAGTKNCIFYSLKINKY